MTVAMDAAKWIALAYLVVLIILSVIHHVQKPGPPRHTPEHATGSGDTRQALATNPRPRSGNRRDRPEASRVSADHPTGGDDR